VATYARSGGIVNSFTANLLKNQRVKEF